MSAAHDGFDPAHICEEALEQQQSWMADAREEAKERRGS